MLDILLKHIADMHWVERGAYLHDRGWRVSGPPECEWVSPHDGLIYAAKDGVMMEMLREMEGNPTPRLGHCRDPRKGECEF